jgi:hypothetical protein
LRRAFAFALTFKLEQCGNFLSSSASNECFGLFLFLIGIVSAQAAISSPSVLSDEAARVLRPPDGAILYSIEPVEQPKPGDKVLHGFQVQDWVNLDPKREQLAASFSKAVTDWGEIVVSWKRLKQNH